MTVIYSENKTQFLVLSSGKILDCSFSDLFTKVDFKKDSKTLMIPNTTLYIRDALGWTKISKIRLIEKEVIPLKLFINNNCVIVSTTILIPVYNNQIIRGFHGEIKYSCNLKSIDQIKENDLGMFFDYSNNKICQLINYKLKPENDLKLNGDWFEIQTSSEFFNVNGIQLHV